MDGDLKNELVLDEGFWRGCDSSGNLFRLAVEWSGIRPAEIARRANCSRSTVGNWINGVVPAGYANRTALWRVLGFDYKQTMDSRTLGRPRILPIGKYSEPREDGVVLLEYLHPVEEEVWRIANPEGMPLLDMIAWFRDLQTLLGMHKDNKIGQISRLPAGHFLISLDSGLHWLVLPSLHAHQAQILETLFLTRAPDLPISEDDLSDWINEGARPAPRIRSEIDKIRRTPPRDPDSANPATHRQTQDKTADREWDWNAWMELTRQVVDAGLHIEAVRHQLFGKPAPLEETAGQGRRPRSVPET